MPLPSKRTETIEQPKAIRLVSPLPENTIQEKHHSELLARLDELLIGQQMLLHGALKSDDASSWRQAPQTNGITDDGVGPVLGAAPSQLAAAFPESEASRKESKTSQRHTLTKSHTYESAVETHRLKSEKQEEAKRQRSEQGDVVYSLQRAVQDIVSSRPFEAFFACLIVVSAVLMGVQVDYTATHVMEPPPLSFQVLQHTFNFLFFIELALRVIAERLHFFCSSWNWLDFVIVAASIFETIVALLAVDGDGFTASSNLRVFRLLRVSRLAKVIRIVRIVKFVRALRTLVVSIVLTLKSLVWSMLLLVVVLFVFGIVFTDSVTGHYKDVPWTNDSASDILRARFGSLPRTMLTLFAAPLGGFSWITVVEALDSISKLWGLIFCLYMSFCLFALFNVVTGVFCQGAIEGAERDQEMLVHAVMQDRDRYLGGLRALFNSIDDDGSGHITCKEFEDHLSDDRVRCIFRALQLDPEDAWELFVALDSDGSGTIDADEFLDGCIHLRGYAKAINLASLRRHVNKIKDKLQA